MNKTGTINPWALLGIGVMVCLTAVALTAIFLKPTLAAQQTQTASAGANLAQGTAPAGIYDQAQNDPIPQGAGCGMGGGGGCGCGG